MLTDVIALSPQATMADAFVRHVGDHRNMFIVDLYLLWSLRLMVDMAFIVIGIIFFVIAAEFFWIARKTSAPWLDYVVGGIIIADGVLSTAMGLYGNLPFLLLGP